MAYPLINGIYPDHASIEVKLKGTVSLGVKEIQYDDSLEPGEVRGTHAQMLGRTRGEYKTSGSLTLFATEWEEFRRRLGSGFMEAVFDVVVNYRPPGSPMATDTLVGCRIKKVEKSSSAGSDPIAVKLELHIMRINWNGLDPLKKMLPSH